MPKKDNEIDDLVEDVTEADLEAEDLVEDNEELPEGKHYGKKKMSEEDDSEDDDDDDDDDDEDDDIDEKAMDKAHKKKQGPKGGVKETFNFKEDLDALIAANSETLSEDFQKSAATIFEAAVTSRIDEEIERLEESYETRLNEEVEAIREDLEGKVNSYLNYIADHWMAENTLAVENGLRTEIAEDFMVQLKDLFVESYIEVPESKYDLVEGLVEKVSALEEELDSTVNDNIELAESFNSLKRDTLVEKAAEGLALTDADKFNKLVEGIEYTTEEEFTGKLNTIKESYFGKKKADAVVEEENLVSESTDTKELSPQMQSYLKAIRKTVK